MSVVLSGRDLLVLGDLLDCNDWPLSLLPVLPVLLRDMAVEPALVFQTTW